MIACAEKGSSGKISKARQCSAVVRLRLGVRPRGLRFHPCEPENLTYTRSSRYLSLLSGFLFPVFFLLFIFVVFRCLFILCSFCSLSSLFSFLLFIILVLSDLRILLVIIFLSFFVSSLSLCCICLFPFFIFLLYRSISPVSIWSHFTYTLFSFSDLFLLCSVLTYIHLCSLYIHILLSRSILYYFLSLFSNVPRSPYVYSLSLSLISHVSLSVFLHLSFSFSILFTSKP